MNQQILQNFPFIIEKRVCSDCGTIIGFQVKTHEGLVLKANELEKSLIKPEKKEILPNKIENEKITEKGESTKIDIEKLMMIDERLAKLQIIKETPLKMNDFIEKETNSKIDYDEGFEELQFGVVRK